MRDMYCGMACAAVDAMAANATTGSTIASPSTQRTQNASAGHSLWGGVELGSRDSLFELVRDRTLLRRVLGYVSPGLRLVPRHLGRLLDRQAERARRRRKQADRGCEVNSSIVVPAAPRPPTMARAYRPAAADWRGRRSRRSGRRGGSRCRSRSAPEECCACSGPPNSACCGCGKRRRAGR